VRSFLITEKIISRAFHRFTDFLVYEVDLEGHVAHIESLAMPESPTVKDKSVLSTSLDPASLEGSFAQSIATEGIARDSVDAVTARMGVHLEQFPEGLASSEEKWENAKVQESWTEHFNTVLAPFLSPDVVAELKALFLEGPEPPRINDAGWSGRQANITRECTDGDSPSVLETNEKGKRVKKVRGGQGRRTGNGKEDHRKVLSNVCLFSVTLALRN
jgi:tRNA pseudouridine13 synthase